MTPTMWLALLLAGWLALGVGVAVVLGRRGFDAVSWFLIAIVLGPLSLLVAWNCVRRDERLAPEIIRAHDPVSARTGVDVLVGFDGSPESQAAVASVTALLGERLGRVRLAAVVPFDDVPEAEVSARSLLEGAARQFPALSMELEIVHGRPARALTAAAQEGGFDLLAVGTTKKGHAHLFGSAAADLAEHSDIPVLLAGP